MACFVLPEERTLPEYRGIRKIFEYTNWDGSRCRTNCGQAAAATLLTYHRKLPADEEHAHEIMADIERAHPPDNVGGLFGTSRRRVTRICRSFDLTLRPIEGADELRTQLDYQNPVAVMLGIPGGHIWKYELPAGHWMVAYAYDRANVYLTNWGSMTWAEFERGWARLVPRLIGMRRRGLMAVSPAVEL